MVSVSSQADLEFTILLLLTQLSSIIIRENPQGFQAAQEQGDPLGL